MADQDARVAVVRHGKAEQGSPSGLDADRPLRPRGERQAVWLGGWLGRNGFDRARLIASHATRARRTAELIAETLGLEVEFDDGLLVGQPVSAGLAVIQSALDAGDRRLIVAGHNPQVSGLASIGGGALVSGGVLLRTGECVVVRVPAGRALGEMGEIEAVVRLDEA